VDSPARPAPVDLETVNENWATGIFKNREWNWFQRWREDSEVLVARVDSENINENWVGGEWVNVNESSSNGDKWIIQRVQHLVT
jgi:hypothetical protein